MELSGERISYSLLSAIIYKYVVTFTNVFKSSRYFNSIRISSPIYGGLIAFRLNV